MNFFYNANGLISKINDIKKSLKTIRKCLKTLY